MIGKIPDRRRDGKSSFRDLIAYCTTQNPAKVAHVGIQYLLSPETAALEMESLASDNARCRNPVFHVILSWREFELPTNEQVDEAVDIALRELNLQDCQALWALQNDTQNRHVHIVVNRIHPATGRAIQPANNWTYRAVEKAARTIELRQGWEIEQSGRFFVTDDGEIIEKRKGSKEARVSNKSHDSEAHTAIKSPERVCLEIAAPILREAKSWRELHERLAKEGIAFERKGSGALLHVLGVAIKPSSVGRDVSLSKLSDRLGAFVPRNDAIRIAERQPEPVEKVVQRGVDSEWERYSTLREEYFRNKNAASALLMERHKKERVGLCECQRSERTTAFAGSWRGKGALLNRQRSVTAARQLGEKLDLRDRQKKELDEFRQIYPRRFVSFKEWLEEERSQGAFLAFRYPDQGTMRESGENPGATTKADLRAFTPRIGNRGGVAYALAGAQEANFVDYGRKIVMAQQCGEEAILAALQLACQKWGGVFIDGSDEYRRTCVELAIRHNLRISNPELAREIEERRNQKNEEEGMKTTDIKSIFTRYADAVGAKRFRIVVMEFTKDGTRAFLYDRQNGGYEGKTLEEMLNALPKFSSFTRHHKNIIVFPLSGDKHHILVDDLTPDKLRQLRDDGYSPACVIESSPENYQAILTVPASGGNAEADREAANRLTKELNLKYGDSKLSGSVHGHRLPPFENFKPKHRRDDGSYPATALVEAKGGCCEKARLDLDAASAFLREAQKKTERAMAAQRRASHDHPEEKGSDPDGAYWAHYRDIASKFRGVMDYSRIDAMIGIRMRVTDYAPGEVQSAIERNAPAMRRETMSREAFDAKYRNRDWRRFASETTEKFVFGPRGSVQFEKALNYRPLYLSIEGRSHSRTGDERREKSRNRGR